MITLSFHIEDETVDGETAKAVVTPQWHSGDPVRNEVECEIANRINTAVRLIVSGELSGKELVTRSTPKVQPQPKKALWLPKHRR